MAPEQRLSLVYAVGLLALATGFFVGLCCQATWAMWIFGPLALLAVVFGLMSGLPKRGGDDSAG